MLAVAVLAVAVAGAVLIQSVPVSDFDAADGDVSSTEKVVSVTSGSTVVQYGSFDEAIASASSGSIVKLLSDVNSSGVTVEKDLTIDLDGKTITFTSKTGNYAFVVNSGSLSIENGTMIDQTNYGVTTDGHALICISGAGSDVTLDDLTMKAYNPNGGEKWHYVVRVLDGASLTLSNGCEIVPMDNTEEYTQDSDSGLVGIYIRGTPELRTILEINDSSILSTSYAISGNGNPCNPAQIGMTKNGNTEITINSGTIQSLYLPGIYNPQYGDVVINGGHIEGSSGIEIRSGTLSVYGGSIMSNSDSFQIGPNGNGPTSRGVGIVVTQHTTKQPIRVTVTGGAVSGCYGLYEATPQQNSVPERVSMSVTGGTITGFGYDAVYSQNKTSFITGGTFNSDVRINNYVADSVSVQEKSGLWYVGEVVDPTPVISGDDVVIPKVDSDEVSFVVVSTQDKATIQTEFSEGIALKVSVTNLASGAYTFSASKVNLPAAGKNVLKIDTPNVDVTSITVSVPIEVPSGHYVSSVKAYYYNEATGQKTYLSDVSYSGGMLSFTTDHNSYYGYEYSTSAVVYDDDDDYYPIVPVTPASTSSNDDDTKTIVACAAAAVAAALAVAFFLVDSRRP